METRDVIALFGVCAGLLAFFSGLVQYRKGQQWKRLEFVANELKASFANDDVQRALLFLDWNLNSYDLSGGESEAGLREVWISDDDLERAMVPHPDRRGGFTQVEIRIRASFDAFFETLRRFEHFVEVGLVHENDFRPYLRYWLDRLCKPARHAKSVQVLQSIWRYIDFYDYVEVKRFVNRYGYHYQAFIIPQTRPAEGKHVAQRTAE
jgi:hypothetical protein